MSVTKVELTEVREFWGVTYNGQKYLVIRKKTDKVYWEISPITPAQSWDELEEKRGDDFNRKDIEEEVMGAVLTKRNKD